jgi:hypothetical protein
MALIQEAEGRSFWMARTRSTGFSHDKELSLFKTSPFKTAKRSAAPEAQELVEEWARELRYLCIKPR